MWGQFIVCLFTFLFFLLNFFQWLGIFTGRKTASFPFGLASEQDQTIYSPDCAPVGFRLIDPDHLNLVQVNALLNHWLDRQRKKLQPFIVLTASPLHQQATKMSEKAKGKRKIPYEPVSDDDDDINPDGGGSAGEGDGDEGDGSSVDSEDDQDEEGEDRRQPPGRVGPPTGKRPRSNLQGMTLPDVGPSSRPQDPPSHLQASGSSSKPPPSSLEAHISKPSPPKKISKGGKAPKATVQVVIGTSTKVFFLFFFFTDL